MQTRYPHLLPALGGASTTRRNGVCLKPTRLKDTVLLEVTEDSWVQHRLFRLREPHDFAIYDAIKLQCDAVEALEDELAVAVGVAAENVLLKEEIARLKQTIFGTSSEKSISEQPELEQMPGEPVPQQPAEVETPAKKQRVSGAGRKPLPEHLPREPVNHDLESHEKFCPCCHKPFERIGEEVTEQFAVVPMQFKVHRHIRAKYVCRDCNKFATAPGFKAMIEKSSYSSPEFLAHVACSKYQYGLPFYRQEDIFKKGGVQINRTTLASLMIRCSDKLVALTESLRHCLLGQRFIHADETVVQVLKEPDRRPQANSYLWLYRSLKDESRQVVLFDYQMTRSGEHPRRFLNMGTAEAFSGYLHCDGYAGYNGLTGVTRVGCMTHVRRKFIEARDALPAGTTGSPAHVAIELIGKLYGIERRIKNLDHQVRYRVRMGENIPILQQFKDWLDKTCPTVAPKTALGRAMGYAREQWQHVARYVEDGRLAIDNNIAEQEIKAVVIGRKNWLFADSMDGMRANAAMYSLVQTAKANGINPFEYLRYVFETMPKLKTADEVESLLPWNMPR